MRHVSVSQPSPHLARNILSRELRFAFHTPSHDESFGSPLARNTVVLPQIREGKSIRRFRAFAPYTHTTLLSPLLACMLACFVYYGGIFACAHARYARGRERVVELSLSLLLVVEGLHRSF